MNKKKVKKTVEKLINKQADIMIDIHILKEQVIKLLKESNK